MGVRGCWRLLSVIALVLIVDSGCGNADLEVKTPYGTYRGHLIKSRGGRDLLSFKGIPYAQPPVGPLRFKEPVKLEEREGTFVANEETICVQTAKKPDTETEITEENHQNKSIYYIGSEDCLYLNIYRPKDVPMDKLLPVYFWIHGGGFMSGSATDAQQGPSLLLDKNRDMIMVAINYRLGIFGFLSTNDVNLPGNLGLKDQTMALKWVNENIKLFGGDPNSVTIGGASAGAASVNHHMNSKASQGLFHRAVSQSGTADCSWARKSIEESRDIACNLISFLGCPFEPNELLECLQELPIEILLSSINTLKVGKIDTVAYLVPVPEIDSPTAFMTKESIARGSDVPWLTGVTSEEGLLFYHFLASEEPAFLDLSILKKDYITVLPIVAYYNPKQGENGLTRELKDFYFGDKDFRRETTSNFVQLLSDRMFNHGLIQSARKHKGKLYMYKISYKGKNTMTMLKPKGLESGVSHGEDMIYFFNDKSEGISKLNDKDLDLSNTLLEMWYNFIKYGDPTPKSQLWKDSKGGTNYLDFTNNGHKMSFYLFQSRMEFLDKLENKWKFQDEL